MTLPVVLDRVHCGNARTGFVQYSITPRTITSAKIAQNCRLARSLHLASSVVKTGFCLPSCSGRKWLAERFYCPFKHQTQRRNLCLSKNSSYEQQALAWLHFFHSRHSR